MSTAFGVTMTPLADFLLARIVEDETAADKEGPITKHQILAECAAKRQIIKRARRAFEAGDIALQTFGGEEPHHRTVRASYLSSSMVWQNVLRLLAQPYADHQDYREEWKP